MLLPRAAARSCSFGNGMGVHAPFQRPAMSRTSVLADNCSCFALFAAEVLHHGVRPWQDVGAGLESRSMQEP